MSEIGKYEGNLIEARKLNKIVENNRFVFHSSRFSPYSLAFHEKSDFFYYKNKIVKVDETNNVFNKYVSCVYVSWK
jgi:hypothetical protein